MSPYSLLVLYSDAFWCSSPSLECVLVNQWLGAGELREARCVGVRRPVGSEEEVLPRLSGKLVAQWEAFRERGSKHSLKDRDPGAGRKSAHT